MRTFFGGHDVLAHPGGTYEIHALMSHEATKGHSQNRN